MVTGAGIAMRESMHVVPFLPLLTAALSVFWLRTPVESLLGTSAMRVQTKDEHRIVTVIIAILCAIVATALGALLWAGRNRDLWWIGIAAGTAFIGQTMLKRLGRCKRMLSEVVGTVGLTASAPAAYCVTTGTFNTTAWVLWLANLIFAGDLLHYVQFRIHTARLEGVGTKLARGWAFALGQAVLTLALTMACVTGLMPKLASLAFAPVLFRGWLYFIRNPGPLLVRKLGWSELGHAVTFCVLFIAAFAWTR